MPHPNEVLVREANAALGRREMDAFRNQYFAEDIRWHIPGRSPLAGDYEGVAQVLEYSGRVLELSGGTLVVELRDVLANDEHVVTLFTIRAERAGKHWEDSYVTVSRIRDGKLAEHWSYPGDQYAYDEFWS
jgi:ketosteroid isomerase-like protein